MFLKIPIKGISTTRFLIIFAILGIICMISLRASDSALPGDLNYPLDQFSESWQYVFTTEYVDRVRLELIFANERLLEAKNLARYPGRGKDFREALTRMRDHIYSTEKLISDSRILGREVNDLLVLYPENSLFHLEVLIEIYFQTPKQLQPDVAKSINVSVSGYENSLNNLPNEKSIELKNSTAKQIEKVNKVLKEINIATPQLDP